MRRKFFFFLICNSIKIIISKTKPANRNFIFCYKNFKISNWRAQYISRSGNYNKISFFNDFGFFLKFNSWIFCVFLQILVPKKAKQLPNSQKSVKNAYFTVVLAARANLLFWMLHFCSTVALPKAHRSSCTAPRNSTITSISRCPTGAEASTQRLQSPAPEPEPTRQSRGPRCSLSEETSTWEDVDRLWSTLVCWLIGFRRFSGSRWVILLNL